MSLRDDDEPLTDSWIDVENKTEGGVESVGIEEEYDTLDDFPTTRPGTDTPCAQSNDKSDTCASACATDRDAVHVRYPNANDRTTRPEPGSEGYRAAQEERRAQLLHEGSSTVEADHALRTDSYQVYIITNRSDRRPRTYARATDPQSNNGPARTINECHGRTVSEAGTCDSLLRA